MTIGNAAIHAARRLLDDFGIRHRNGEFAKMADTVGGRLILHHLPVDLQKTCYLAHVLTSNPLLFFEMPLIRLPAPSPRLRGEGPCRTTSVSPRPVYGERARRAKRRRGEGL